MLAPYPSSFGCDIDNYDVMYDFPVNNYIGYRSLYKNLEMVDRYNIKVNKLRGSDKGSLMHGLGNALPRGYRDKIWELITKRYEYLLRGGYIVETV